MVVPSILRIIATPENQVVYLRFTDLEGEREMMHDLLLDALLLMILWLSTMLWVWRRRQAPPAKLTTSPPNAPRGICKTRSRFRVSPPSPAVPPVSTPLRRPRCAFPARRHCGAPRVGVGIRRPPRSTIVPRRSVTTMAGPDWAICGPTAIQVAAPAAVALPRLRWLLPRRVSTK